MLIADFTLDTEPVGLGLTGLAALALGTGSALLTFTECQGPGMG